MKTRSRAKSAKSAAAAVEIAWSHAGQSYRVTAWPEVAFERLCGGEWLPDRPSEGAFAAAAAYVRDAAWRRYLEFVPAEERAFVAQFRFSRLEALEVAVRCPELVPVLSETPALTVFVSAHVALRGESRPVWDEISALYERAGLFGLLEWLGLPATRQALAALRNFADPEIPRRFLTPLRAALWKTQVAAALERSAVVTDLDLARHCYAAAA